MKIQKEQLSMDELYDKVEQVAIDVANHDLSNVTIEWFSASEPVFIFPLQGSTNLSFKIYFKGETYSNGMFVLATSYLEMHSGNETVDINVGDKEVGEVDDPDFFETFSTVANEMVREGQDFIDRLKIQ